MNRHRIVYSLVLAVAGISSSASLAQEGLADHHTHIRSAALGEKMGKICGVLAACDAEQLKVPVTADDLIAVMDTGGVDKASVLALGYFAGLPELEMDAETQWEMTRRENKYVANEIAKYPDRLIGFFSVNPLADYALDEARFWAADDRLTGLKLHLANSDLDFNNESHIEKLAALFEIVDAQSIPVLLHMRNRNPAYGTADAEILIERILSNTSNSHITLAHLAGWGAYDAATDNAIAAFETAFKDGALDPQRFTFDVAAVVIEQLPLAGREMIAPRLRSIGLDRIVFGSDWERDLAPFAPGAAAAALSGIGLTDAEVARILANRAPYLQ